MNLRGELAKVLNSFSQENNSNSPDFVLAGFIVDSLAAFDRAVNAREAYFGRPVTEAVVSPQMAKPKPVVEPADVDLTPKKVEEKPEEPKKIPDAVVEEEPEYIKRLKEANPHWTADKKA